MYKKIFIFILIFKNIYNLTLYFNISFNNIVVGKIIILCSPRLHFFYQKYSRNRHIVKYYYDLNELIYV